MSDIPLSVIEDFLREHKLTMSAMIREVATCVLSMPYGVKHASVEFRGTGPTLVHAFANARANYLAWKK